REKAATLGSIGRSGSAAPSTPMHSASQSFESAARARVMTANNSAATRPTSTASVPSTGKRERVRVRALYSVLRVMASRPRRLQAAPGQIVGGVLQHLVADAVHPLLAHLGDVRHQLALLARQLLPDRALVEGDELLELGAREVGRIDASGEI